MPRIQKQGVRRSGQGVAPPALGKPIVKNFDLPRPPFMTGAGGSPSSSADQTISRRDQQHVPPYYGNVHFGMDDESEGEGDCGGTVPGCGCQTCLSLSEELVRESVRMVIEDIDRDELAHLALDICGLVPGVGEICDLTNAVLYARKGEWMKAGLSLVSVIPEIGDLIGKSGKIPSWLDDVPEIASAVAQASAMSDKLKDLRLAIKENWSTIDRILDHVKRDGKFGKNADTIREWLLILSGMKKSGQTGYPSKSGGVQSKKKKKAPEQELEASAVGGISGYTLPLGAKPKKPKT